MLRFCSVSGYFISDFFGGYFWSLFQWQYSSHLANTVAIRHAAAGAGCWFWLDPALVHSGCCGRDSASVIVFFHTISTHSHLLRSGLYFFECEFNLRSTCATCNFSRASAASKSHFVPHFYVPVSISPCSPPHPSACVVDTLCRPILPVHGCLVFWLHSDIKAYRVGTSSPSAGDIRGHVAPPRCPCCMSVLSSRSCLPMSSSVRTLYPPPSPIHLLIVNQRHSFRLLSNLTASDIN